MSPWRLSAEFYLSAPQIGRQYKKALATAAAFVLLLVAGVVTSTLLAVWATTAQREADRQRVASDEAGQEAVHARQEAVNAKAEATNNGMRLVRQPMHPGSDWCGEPGKRTMSSAPANCSGVLKEAAGRKLRGFEWYYLSRLCHSER